MPACVILFFVGLIIGVILAWIYEDKRINKLTVENRQLIKDKEKMTNTILKLKNGSSK